jgi:hypothetical protein
MNGGLILPRAHPLLCSCIINKVFKDVAKCFGERGGIVFGEVKSAGMFELGAIPFSGLMFSVFIPVFQLG